MEKTPCEKIERPIEIHKVLVHDTRITKVILRWAEKMYVSTNDQNNSLGSQLQRLSCDT
jgi:hypothetical protein